MKEGAGERARLLRGRTAIAAAAATAGSAFALHLALSSNPSSYLLAPAEESAAELIFSAVLACFEEDSGSSMVTPCKERVAEEETSRASLASIDAAIRLGLERRPDVFGNACHTFAHLVGQEAGSRLPGVTELAAAAALSTEVCQFGFYHGLVEGYAHSLSLEELRREMHLLCGFLEEGGSSRPELEYAEGDCNHALGHVSARATSDHMPHGLALCDRLPHDGAREACALGVVMNWTDNVHLWLTAGRDPSSAPSYMPVDPERRWEVCLHVPERHQPACASWMGSATMADVTSEPELIKEALEGYAAWCSDSFSSSKVVESCWISVGRMGGNLETMNHLGGWEGALDLCSRAGPHRQVCTTHMLTVAETFLQAPQIASLCQATAASQELCSRAEELAGAAR